MRPGEKRSSGGGVLGRGGWPSQSADEVGLDLRFKTLSPMFRIEGSGFRM